MTLEERSGPTAIVWRVLTYESGALCSQVTKVPFPSGELVAACPRAKHSAPDPNCTCGIYAYYQAYVAWEHRVASMPRQALAMCNYSGVTVVGGTGVRTEHLYIRKCYMVGAENMDGIEVDALYDRYPGVEFVFEDNVSILTTLQG